MREFENSFHKDSLQPLFMPRPVVSLMVTLNRFWIVGFVLRTVFALTTQVGIKLEVGEATLFISGNGAKWSYALPEWWADQSLITIFIVLQVHCFSKRELGKSEYIGGT